MTAYAIYRIDSIKLYIPFLCMVKKCVKVIQNFVNLIANIVSLVFQANGNQFSTNAIAIRPLNV